MNYRSISNLNTTIVNNIHRVPRDVDVIVGIPRSGLLAANILALHLNLPIADVDAFKSGRLLSSGPRHGLRNRPVNRTTNRKALIVDDSIASGRAMKEARLALEGVDSDCEYVFAAVYATSESRSQVDLHFEICPLPRVFEWNIFHHSHLRRASVDIDGVLCRDPTEEENDDGPRYEDFISRVEPFHIPSLPVGQLVTCRLEKYRQATEAWLQQNQVEYSELIMMQYATKEERLRAGSHGRFKADVYRASPNVLFIESSLRQATEIARVSGKSVFCMENREMISPPFGAEAIQTMRERKWSTEHKLRHMLNRVARKFRIC